MGNNKGINENEFTVEQLIGSLPKDYLKPSRDELNEFSSYIARFSWRNAKTYEQFASHDYDLGFEAFVN